MLAHTHIIINTSIALFLHFLGYFSASDAYMFIAGGIVFDIDHLFYFLFAERTLSIKRMMAVGRQLLSTLTPKLYVFHTIEFFLIFLVVGYMFSPLTPLFLGFSLHLLLDIYNYVSHGKKFSWAPYWSLIYMTMKKPSKHYK